MQIIYYKTKFSLNFVVNKQFVIDTYLHMNENKIKAFNVIHSNGIQLKFENLYISDTCNNQK